MKKIDLNAYGVSKMSKQEMKDIQGGWRLFGKEVIQGAAYEDAECCGYRATIKKYFLGICYSAENVNIPVDC